MRKRRESIDPRRMRIALIAAAVMVFIAVPLFLSRPHENRFEREAHHITDAIAAGDASAALADFTPELQRHSTPAVMAKTAGMLAPLGKLTSVREVTAHDAAPGAHDFVARFENGGVAVHVRYAIGGKIEAFRFDDPVRN